MQRILFIIGLIGILNTGNSQPLMTDIRVVNEKQESAEGASIALINANNKSLEKAAITDAKGVAAFNGIAAGEHYFTISQSGYQSQTTPVYKFPLVDNSDKARTIILLPAVASLQGVTVVGTRPFIQHEQGKVLVNVDASVTNAGTTVLELLEKSPGVMVNKNGPISLQAKTGVLIMIAA